MKTIKFLFFLIILGLLGLFVYQNLDYFMTKQALSYDLKIATWQWVTPELPAIAYWGICLGAGLLLTGVKGLITAFGLGREIKKRDASIVELEKEISDLNTQLKNFTHDPYIQKTMTPSKQAESDETELPEVVESEKSEDEAAVEPASDNEKKE